MSELNLSTCPICYAEESLTRETMERAGRPFTWYECQECGSVLLWMGGVHWAYQKVGREDRAHLLKQPIMAAELQALLEAQERPIVAPLLPEPAVPPTAQAVRPGQAEPVPPKRRSGVSSWRESETAMSRTVVYCPKCGHPAPNSTEAYCRTCGASLQGDPVTKWKLALGDGINCPYCDAVLDPNDTFCFRCGKQVAGPEEQEEPKLEGKQRKRQPYWSWWIPLVLTAGLFFGEVSRGVNDAELVGHAVTNLFIYGVIFGIIGLWFRVPVEPKPKKTSAAHRPRRELTRVFHAPLLAGCIGGIVAGLYSASQGAAPIRIVLGAMGGAFFWSAVIGFIAWLMRPSVKRATPWIVSVALFMLLGGGYLLLSYWTDSYYGYIGVPECIPWQQAGNYIGEQRCVCGDVLRSGQYSNGFIIQFSQSGQAFYGFSSEYYWNDLEGDCIAICGQIAEKNGRPRILIDDPESQVFDCP